MFGAISGDVIGSVYEWNNVKRLDFPLFSADSRFTDDTVLTVATADALLHGRDYAAVYREYHRRYPDAGYGARFRTWAEQPDAPAYHSYGNGSAMRVSPVALARRSLAKVLREAERSAAVTHDHPEGIKGAQATAAAVYLAHNGTDRDTIRRTLSEQFGYGLDTPLAQIRAGYRFDVSCQGSVPHALRAFLEGNDFEDTLRRAISIGGDSDTIACIAGAVAEAFFGGVPEPIWRQVAARLPAHLLDVVQRFTAHFSPPA